ncbi:hypothetical protein [Inquilinus sp.]|uniref:hypothetical protein n=1 Tax=Inquilinus sp. TaxID=1932117 RepID=UPI0031E0DE5F
MTDRSSQIEVRNPMLTLPAMLQLQQLPPDSQAAIEAILRDLSHDAAARAEKAWRQRKGPMAVYWKAAAVYALHTARAIARSRRRGRHA